jgi:fido (protein-threonine AMPylation protein)
MEQRTEKFKLEDFGEYLNQGNPDIKEKAYVWAAALGLQATDGLRTSYEMRRTARQYIEGRLTIDEVRQHINEYYKSNPPATTDKEKEQEADKVACNIADVLFNKRLDFSTDGYLNLHRQIFSGVYDHAGQLRANDIVKSEWVLEKDTVFYLHWEELRMALDSNFQFERNQHYDELNKEDLLEWIAFFTAGIWHIHPFNEGNTRTIAVFSILLLRPLGYDIHTDVFADHSWYFRNAMVRANYMNELKHIHVNPDFLIRFYRNWMFGDQWDLRNRYLAIHPTLAWLNQPNLAEKQEE